jgi:hypothetical protein
MSGFGKVEREHEEYGVGPGENLKVFEKTWGHRLLMGLSVCMFVAGLVLAIYCGMRVHSIQELLSQNIAYSYAFAFYAAGLVIGAAIIPPAILGVFVATHPKTALAAVVAAVIALLIVVAFAIYSASIGGQAFSIALYTMLFAIVPVVYLICALKIKRS